MSSKHFISDPTRLVNTALHSITLTNPNVGLDPKHKIVYRRPIPGIGQKVAIVSGGGSGHEPSFSSLVGDGLLSAAVAGTIFASPSASQVQVAITSRTPRDQDVLVIVMNYTGDILNFGVAMEKARACERKDRKVEMVVVGDDVGVGRAKSGKVGRRGIAGTVMVVKIAGALAARGYAIADVAKAARLTAENLVSVGASLAHVHVPGRTIIPAEEEMEGNQVELGMGIHNEDGSARVELGDLENLVDDMLKQLLDQSDNDRAFLNVTSKNAVLMVNNLGGVSVLEMGGIVSEVVKQLDEKHDILPTRILSGTYMTSLNGLGFSISLLNVVDTGIDGAPGMIELLDDAAEAAGWSAPIKRETWEGRNTASYQEEAALETENMSGNLKINVADVNASLTRGLHKVIGVESEVTQYDTIVGDGDCGIGLKRGAEAILAHLSQFPLTGDAVADVASIVSVVEDSMDGTSGALYTIFLHSLVHALRQISSGAANGPGDDNEADAGVWAKALGKSLEALARYTPARPGDRTLVDALHPFIEVLGRTGNMKEAAVAARNGADGTKGMKASLGRTVYVGGDGFKQVPDPGAYGLAAFLEGMAGL